MKADKILEWARQNKVHRNTLHIKSKVIDYGDLILFLNSLVSKDGLDNEPRHHISCVNCAIEWARQYESDEEIVLRVIDVEFPTRMQQEAWTLAEYRDFLDKDGE